MRKYHLRTNDNKRGGWMTAAYERTVEGAIKWGIDEVASGNMDHFDVVEDDNGTFTIIGWEPEYSTNPDADPWYIQYADKYQMQAVLDHYAKATRDIYRRIEDSECGEVFTVSEVRRMVQDDNLTDLRGLCITEGNITDGFTPFEWITFNDGYGVSIDPEDPEQNPEELRGQWRRAASDLLEKWLHLS